MPNAPKKPTYRTAGAPTFEIQVHHTGAVSACPWYQQPYTYGMGTDASGQPVAIDGLTGTSGCEDKWWWRDAKGWWIPLSVPVAVALGLHLLGAGIVWTVLGTLVIGVPGSFVAGIALNPSSLP